MLAQVVDAHPDLSDWLVLAAFIVFVIKFVFTFVSYGPTTTPSSPIGRLDLIALGLALFTLGFFVL